MFTKYLEVTMLRIMKFRFKHDIVRCIYIGKLQRLELKSFMNQLTPKIKQSSNRGSIIVCALCNKSVCKVLLKTKIQCVLYNLIFRSFAQKKGDKIYVFCTKR